MKKSGKPMFNPSESPPDPSDAVAAIAEKRSTYVAYNISRLRELIRYLPAAKLKLFNTIPLMLHLNSPHFPGYVDGGVCIHGIVNFEGTGFFNQALSLNHLTPDDITPFTTTSPVILALFHIGSAGTLTQSEKSDFDYWVIIDHRMIDDHQLTLLQEKLTCIEKYCDEVYGQEVTFFVHDTHHIQNNDFATVDVSSFGLAPRTVLKEEFYRTFIMIAGKMPFWAVMDAGLDDEAYRSVMDYIDNTPSLRSLKDHYIDIGNLHTIDDRECLGVILWQIFKARFDPVKSLVKASLIANYYFYQDRDNPLLCNYIKAHFHQALIDDHKLDPYVLVFKTIVQFYQKMMDEDGVSLVRTAIFFRLCGFPFVSLPDAESPKGLLLKRYARAWNMKKKSATRLASYNRWPETEKQAFDDRLFKKMSFLYELILRNQDEKLLGIEMNEFDLSILKNSIASFLTRKPGKLPKCSVWLAQAKHRLNFLITDRGHDGTRKWHIYYVKKRTERDDTTLVFNDSDALKATGWLLANQLFVKSAQNVTFEIASDNVLGSRASTGFLELADFMTLDGKEDKAVFSKEPVWRSLYGLLKFDRADAGASPHCMDFLVVNSWEEYFFDSVDLSHIANESEKWYKISNVIWGYMEKTPSFLLNFNLASWTRNDVHPIRKSVGDILETYRSQGGKRDAGNDDNGTPGQEDPGKGRPKLFLDEL